MDEKIFEIAKLEWAMFQNVENTGGRASCQDDPGTFFRMRMSQWLAYSEDVVDSYLEDCRTAIAGGQNLVWQKYGWMMESSFPEEFVAIRPHLPVQSAEKAAAIEEVVGVHKIWDQEFAEKYPNLRGRGRAFDTSQDARIMGSSSESYLRGELRSCSEKTVELIRRDTMEAKKNGVNLLQEIIANETRFYGYESLEDAERKHAF